MTTTHERELDLGPEAFTLPPMQTEERIQSESNQIPIRFSDEERWETAIVPEPK